MKNYLVTVVLPIYNVEKYLDRCMESVVGQTYKNLEILMIDDGATDSCPQKCDDWAKKDSRIRVIHKQNAGLGMARNTGIENATGDYIVFFDSDDYIAKNAIEMALESADKYSSDLIIFGFSFVNSSGKVTKSVIPEADSEVFIDDEILSDVLPDLMAQGNLGQRVKGLWISAWVNMYSMDVIKKTGWRFVSEREIISEDVYSLLDLYANLKIVSIVNDALYFYCENEASLTHTYREDRYEKICLFYKKCYKLAESKKYDSRILKNISYPYIANTIGALKLIYGSDSSFGKKYRLINDVLSDNQLQMVISGLDFDVENISRRILLKFMQRKCTFVVMLLLIVKDTIK